MGIEFRHDWVPHLLSKVIDAPLPRLWVITVQASLWACIQVLWAWTLNQTNKHKFTTFLNFGPTLMGIAFRHDWVPHLLSKVIDAPLPRLASIRIHGSEDWMWQLMHSRQHDKLQTNSLIIPKPKMQKKICRSAFKSRLTVCINVTFKNTLYL